MKTVVFWVAVSALAAPAGADLFGTGDTQFTLEFVTISGRTNPAGDYGVVAYDYRISTVEITAEQWQQAGISGGWWSGQQPAASLTWFQAAQFVNWLNINQNRQPAYHFDGETFGLWSADQAWDGTNLFRHKDAYYFLPTEDEWVKAAYWNGTSLQTWTSTDNTKPIAGVDSNYNLAQGVSPWAVGSGSKEFNGTFDMMGNVWEFLESPWESEHYQPGTDRVHRGGSYIPGYGLESSARYSIPPDKAYLDVGFRVAAVPEPASLFLWFLGGIALHRRNSMPSTTTS
ncbi:MAG: SUMF1/EgtB/PvdO family nonheme iron enzyme [Phycisphaerae bacterium]|mgnify:CR=1 FL=1|nr:SUMF1/EgtB/PvdO family nonheme iron enzyme [Phycisphaerae bacterium]